MPASVRFPDTCLHGRNTSIGPMVFLIAVGGHSSIIVENQVSLIWLCVRVCSWVFWGFFLDS